LSISPPVKRENSAAKPKGQEKTTKKLYASIKPNIFILIFFVIEGF
jgi:hypothetical protein